MTQKYNIYVLNSYYTFEYVIKCVLKKVLDTILPILRNWM
ncbi:MAG: hypothetical protein ACI94Y_001900 [Maribacter sp.]|jgi:hypothetical protein